MKNNITSAYFSKVGKLVPTAQKSEKPLKFLRNNNISKNIGVKNRRVRNKSIVDNLELEEH